MGHTVSLLVVGVVVLVFRSAIPVPIANWLEFAVALMIIGLGVLALTRSCVVARPFTCMSTATMASRTCTSIFTSRQRSTIRASREVTLTLCLPLALSPFRRADARPCRIRGFNSSSFEANQVGLVWRAVSCNLWTWLNSRHAFDVRLNRIALCVDLTTSVWISSTSTNCCCGAKHRVRIVVRASNLFCFRFVLELVRNRLEIHSSRNWRQKPSSSHTTNQDWYSRCREGGPNHGHIHLNSDFSLLRNLNSMLPQTGNTKEPDPVPHIAHYRIEEQDAYRFLCNEGV